MKIYSIKEIVDATNNIYNWKPPTSKKKLSTENENAIIASEKKTTVNKKNNNKQEKVLVLNHEISNLTNSKIDTSNHKVEIKPEMKDHIVNELYLYLKKKIRKNTLKIIIEEQLEIKNLKKEINFLVKIKDELNNNYEILKHNYDNVLEDNKKLKISNTTLQNNLNKFIKNEEYLNKENKELKNNELEIKLNYISVIKTNKQLKAYNKTLQNDLNTVAKSKEQLDKKNKELKTKLKETKKNLKDSLEKNRSFEINNAEIKNTLAKYVVNYKKLQEKLSLVKNSRDLKLDKELQKVKFYQDENTRLSSELLSIQRKNEIFKENFRNIEIEKEKISSKIQDLNNSIELKTNIISSPIIKSSSENVKKDVEKLNDKEQKSLDEAINRIFAKV